MPHKKKRIEVSPMPEKMGSRVNDIELGDISIHIPQKQNPDILSIVSPSEGFMKSDVSAPDFDKDFG